MDMSGGAGGGGEARAGPDLRDIETEQLGFLGAAGDDKLQLLPSPWPSDNLPAPTSSLLSVASSKGLVAAAGPDTLVIATTESIRRTFSEGKAEKKVIGFTSQSRISVPRVSHVIFASDESCLAVAAEQGGGLAVYDTNALMGGNTNSAFELGTEGEGVRQILPNPNPASDLAHLFGIVTTSGKLLLADLKERKLVAASSGSNVFHENVSCACWSRLGKQIIAGLGDGTAAQIDRQGVVKAKIPEPPQLAELRDPSSTATPITSILWLETDDFLIIHTPLNPPDSGASDDSILHLAHRDKQTKSWTFSRLTDPLFPFLDRKPANHFILRLREWANINELLIASSTASSDIGMITKSKEALSQSDPIKDTYTETKVPDQRRAALPMNVAGDNDTSPIGMALDLSAQEKVKRPIPTDETLDESPVPIPALYVLNNEGMLSMWWIVYKHAVQQGIIYPDMIAAGGPRPLGEQKPQAQTAAAPQPPQSASSPFGSALGSGPSAPSAFGQAAFGSASTPSQTPAFGKPAFGAASTTGQTSAFGSTPTNAQAPSQAPAFGKPAFGAPSTPAFGGTSAIGNRPSPWGGASSVATGASTFGKPSFGQASTVGQTSFGQVGGMGGQKGSVWGTPSQPQPSPQQPSTSTGSVFGGNASKASPFMSFGGQQPGASGFAALGGGTNKDQSTAAFASAKPSLSNEPSGSTISFGNNTSFGSGSSNFGVQSRSSFFGSPTPSATAGGTFGKPSEPASREESMGDDDGTDAGTSSTAQPLPTQTTNKSPFGLGNGGFKLGSTFKGDGSAKDDLPKPANPGAGLFGTTFGNALGETAKPDPSSENAAWLSGRSTPVIKKEPGTEDEPRLGDIPAAKPKEKAPETAATPTDGDAPLPPDPTTWKPKPGALPPPLPPGFDFGPPKTTEAAPAASQSQATPEQSTNAPEPLAGSPPVDLGRETFSEGVPSEDGAEAEGPPDDEGEWSGVESGDDDAEGEDDDDQEDGSGGDDEDEEDGEGSEEDEQRTPKIQDPTGLSAFQSRLTPASPKRGEQRAQNESTTPATEKKESYTPATEKKESYTPAGMPKAPIMFPPPQRKGPESPRSPSPQRSATSPMRAMPSFGSQPPLPSTTPQQKTSTRTPSTEQVFKTSTSRTPSAQPPQRIAVPPSNLAPSQPRPAPSPQPAEPEEGELEDEEDARIKEILESPIEPMQHMPSFLAHQDYVATGTEKSGCGGQIERVFRDINSMLDTLALNARSLQSFIAGNEIPQDEEPRTRLDVQDQADWLLGEGPQLSGLVDGMRVQLDDGRLTDVRTTLQDLRDEEAALTHLRTKTGDIRKIIAARKDPQQLAQQHMAPLSLETQTAQMELRQEVQKVQALLAKAEEGLSVLRAELASLPAKQGDSAKANVPTAEAVEKTVRKMTQMIERRSGDVDVLEAKVRRLGGVAAVRSANGLASNYEDDLVAGLKASKLSRESPAVGKVSHVRGSSSVGRFGSSAVSRREGTPGSDWKRRSLLDVRNKEVEAYRVKKDARAAILDALREKVEKRGVRVVKAGEV